MSSYRRRNSLRLSGFDYGSRCWYFVTACTRYRVPLFGSVQAGGIALSEAGLIAHDEWLRTAALRADVALDAFVVMPDHFHALLGLHASPGVRPASTLPGIMNSFKAAVTRRAGRSGIAPAIGVWQRGYYDSIVRGARHLHYVRRYIERNPMIAWLATRLPQGSRGE